MSAIVYSPLQLHRVCRGLYPGVLVYLPDLYSTFPGTPQKDLKHDIDNIKHGGERRKKQIHGGKITNGSNKKSETILKQMKDNLLNKRRYLQITHTVYV